MSSKSSKQDPPPLTNAYVRLLLAIGVTVAAALAPLLGRVGVPGFTAILALFPVNVQDTAVPFAAFLMALPAAAIQFYALEKVSARFLRRSFAILLVAIATSVICVFIIFSRFVVDVRVPSMNRVVRYVVGKKMRPDCACVSLGLPIRRCIGAPKGLTVGVEDVEGCYDDDEITQRKIALSLAYFFMMGCFGALIGILVLRQAASRSVIKRKPIQPAE